MAPAKARTFGRKAQSDDSANVDNPNEVENQETPNTNENESEKDMSAEVIENVEESAETPEAEKATETKPAFDLDNIQSTDNNMLDTVIGNAAARIKELEELGNALKSNATLTSDDEVLGYADEEGMPPEVATIKTRYEELRAEVSQLFENLKVVVFSAKGIQPLTQAQIDAKNEEFKSTRERVVSAVEAVKSLSGSFDTKSEIVDGIIGNLRASIPVLPGAKTSGGTSEGAKAPKPRLGKEGGAVFVNGEQIGKNIAPAVANLNQKLPPGTTEITQIEFIESWYSAAGKNDWRQIIGGVTFVIPRLEEKDEEGNIKTPHKFDIKVVRSAS